MEARFLHNSHLIPSLRSGSMRWYNPTMDDATLIYLQSRGISEAVASGALLSGDGSWIRIPVLDRDGRQLFSKYRRHPENPDGPKYRYDAGASMALYNIGILSRNDAGTIWIVEGELDVLRLASEGVSAVSTTGGSGSWNAEWDDYFADREVVICYDADAAGRKGMAKVLRHVPHAKACVLPEGMDITDYLNSGGKLSSLRHDTYAVAKFGAPERELRKCAEACMQAKRNAANEMREDAFAGVLLESIVAELSALRKNRKKKDAKASSNATLEDIKRIPVTNYLTFNADGKCRCIWHDEKTASMKYYPRTNSVYCFGCSRYGDIISVVQQVRGIPTFKEAVAFLRS